jgi:hypothetical protein
MHVVKASEVMAGMEPVAFEDLQGTTHQGGVVSYTQHRRVLDLLTELRGVAAAEVKKKQTEILQLLGFDEAGVGAGLALPGPVFFAVVEDFFVKNRAQRAEGAVDEQDEETDPAQTPGSSSPPRADV